MSDICVDFTNKAGKIKALHGVNNGPVCYSSLVDVSHYFKEAGFPYIRLHDTNWPHPREVDIPQIFPDFSKDPDKPESYDFRRTDEYIKSVLDTGAQIIYRLGTSIEHTNSKYYVHPPENFEKWAKICLGIIKHYNQGWADGFYYNIRYWEIWNEPEGFPDMERSKCPMWTGTYEQYFELYKIVSTAIKRMDPVLKIGGPAYTSVNPEFIEKYLAFCRDEKLPLDFFSYHTYSTDPEQVAKNAISMKELILRYGFSDTECHFNEWNYSAPNPEGKAVFRAGNEYFTESMFERGKNHEGASFDAAVLIILQDCPVNVANFYDAAPSSMWSMFNMYGVPQKAYYAFKAFKSLYDCSNRVQTVVRDGIGGIYCCAGMDNSRGPGAVLISNFSAESREYQLNIVMEAHEAEKQEIEFYVVDENHSLELAKKFEIIEGNPLVLSHFIPRHTVLLLKIG